MEIKHQKHAFLGSSKGFNSGYKKTEKLRKHLDHFTFQMGLTQINNPVDPAQLLLIYRTGLQP